MQSVEKGKQNFVDLESSGSKITCRWITTSFNMTWQFFFLLPLSCWEHMLRIGSVGVEIRSPTTGLFPPWPKSDQIESINIINPAACVSCPHQHVLSPVSTAFLLAGQRWSRGHSHWFSCGLCKCVWNGCNCKLCPSLFFFFPPECLQDCFAKIFGDDAAAEGRRARENLSRWMLGGLALLMGVLVGAFIVKKHWDRCSQFTPKDANETKTCLQKA